MTNLKKCNRCLLELDKSLFSIDKHKVDGLRTMCRQCTALSRLERYQADPEPFKQKAKNYREKYPDRVRLTRVKYTFGLLKEAYEAIPKHCGICGGTYKLGVDHDHDTGKVRELLCVTCNTGLGFLQDNPVLLEKAIKYLERFHQ